MAVNRRVASLLLEFKIARGEIEQSKRAIQQIKSLYADLATEGRQTDRVLAATGNRLSQVSQRTRGQVVPAIHDLRDSLREATEEAERFNEESERAGRERAGHFGIQRIGRLAANVPGLEGVAGGLNIADDIGDVAEVLGTLSPIAVAAAGGIAVLGAGMVALKIALAPVKDAIDSAVNSVEAYYAAIQQGTTTEQAREQIESLNRTLELQRQELALLEDSYNDATRATQDMGEGANLFEAAAQISGALDSQVERMKELRAAIGENESQVAGLTRALDEGVIATNDAAAAEQALAEARQANFDRQIQNEVRILSNVPRTTQALEDRLTQINREQEVLREYMNTAGLSVETTKELEQRFRDLSQEESLLSINLRPLVEEMQAAADAAEAAAERERQAAQDRERLQGEIDRISRDVLKLEEEIADVRQRSAEKVLQIEQDRRDKIAEADRDLQEALSEIDQDAGEERKEAQREANLEREKAEAEHQLALKRIEDRFRVDSLRAIEDRDAVALFRAQEARDQALSEEQEDHKKRLKELDQQLKEQNRQIDKRLAEQTRNAIKRHEEQLRVANEAARKAIQLEQARARKEIQDRQTAIQILLQQQSVYHQQQVKIFQQFGSQMVALETQLASQRLQAASAAGKSLATGKINPGAGSGGGGKPKPPKVPKFDAGGVITKSGLAVVHAGELIMNQRQQRNFGGVNIPINVTAERKEKIIREVMTRLSDALDEVA